MVSCDNPKAECQMGASRWHAWVCGAPCCRFGRTGGPGRGLKKKQRPLRDGRCLAVTMIRSLDQGSGLIGISGVGLAISPVPPSLMKT